MGKYLTTLITFGIIYYMLIMAVAPNIPTAPSLAGIDEASGLTEKMEKQLGKAGEDRTAGIEISDRKRVTAETITSFSFDPSLVGGAMSIPPDIKESVMDKAKLRGNEIIAPVKGYLIGRDVADLVYRGGEEGAYYFAVSLEELTGERVIKEWRYGAEYRYVIFNPSLPENKTAIGKVLGYEIAEEKAKAEAGWKEPHIPSLNPAKWTWDAAKTAGREQLKLINDTTVFGHIDKFSKYLKYDFGLSELLGIPKPFTIGQVISYIWGIAVFIEIFALLPGGGTVGAVIKYVILGAWMTIIAI